jgi:hypothetical protein
MTPKQKEILKIYKSIIIKKGFKPSYPDFMDHGITKHTIKDRFRSLTNLTSIARKEIPEAFKNIVDSYVFTKEKHDKLTGIAKSGNRFVITTAVSGASVDINFLRSIKQYCKLNKAHLLIIPCSDPASNNGWELDSCLSNEYIVFNDVALNNNIFINSIELSAKNIKPITGLERIGQRDGSFIFASPKQFMEPVAVGNTKLPHVIMTTGAITKPNYATEKYLSKRTAYIANHDHTMGAVIVETQNDDIFYFRQIQADSNGAFIDIGTMYNGKKVTKVNADAFVTGDRHCGETCPVADKVWSEVKDLVKPKYVIEHDIFNGLSINHHTYNRKLTRSKIVNNIGIDKELQFVADYLNTEAKKRKIVIVKSNHDEWLNNYLEEGLYIDDPKNLKTSLKLALSVLEGKDPVKTGVEMLLDENVKSNIIWLSRDESFKVAGIELGAHGDKGANGSKGSLVSLEKAYGNCVVGHSHTPKINRGAWQVGTSTHLKLGYNKGPSSWMQSSCIVYPNGSRQLINVIEGKWCLK